jgi:hypothetical protein
MKIIDQTPYYKENGELSIVDRGKAIMQFGFGWFKEIEAQKAIIAVFDKILDKNFTLLQNVIPPGLDARIPFILVGPTGVFVMYVTPLVGMFRAKGDQWGTVTGSTLKPEKPNLLTRTERMARAIQVLLQRQGYSEITEVEAILLCSDPAITVDSLRPIIRVVMRDALERFAVSISQARTLINPDVVREITKRILNPVVPTPPQPAEAAATDATIASAGQAKDPYVPGFALPGSESTSAGSLSQSGLFAQPGAVPAVRMKNRSRKGLTRKQWAFLIIMFVIWCLIMAAFTYLVAKDISF